MNKYISKILIVVGSVALSFVVANSAMAVYPSIQDCANATWTKPVGCDAIMDRYYAGYYSNGYEYVSTTHQNTYNNQPNQYNPYNQPIAYANPAPLTTTPVINNYYYKDESVTAKTTTSTTTKSSTSGSTTAKTNNSTSNTNKVNSDSSNASEEEVFNGGSSSDLTALSFRGSGGFLPSSFWQWLMVIFLILVIVIIARMITKTHRENVHGAPAH